VSTVDHLVCRLTHSLAILVASAGFVAFLSGCTEDKTDATDTDARNTSSSGTSASPPCPLAGADSSLGMTVPPSCTLDRSDTASDPNAHRTWGDYDCGPNQVSAITTGGDTSPTATGAPQPDSAFRKMTVFDPDDFSGERCELGKNSSINGLAGTGNPLGTFYIYREGDRRATYASIRLPGNYILDAKAPEDWQSVLQIKQAAPANGQAGTPILSVKAYDGHWFLFHTPSDSDGPDTPLGTRSPDGSVQAWSVPARKGIWTRMAIDAYFSRDPSMGWVKWYIDANGDGDFGDSHEQSPVFHTNTLKTEPAPGAGESDIGPAEDASIPAHLRVGIYHCSASTNHNPCPPGPDPYPCQVSPGSGCSVDADNVQVVAP
jgi:hypothetical protein